MTGRDYSRSRAILIGNGAFTDHEKIPQVPAPGCVAAMLDLLAGDLCGWPRDRISLFEDLPNLADLARRLVPAVREAQDVLLVYYVGHGMLTMEGDLVLALKDTDADPEALPYTSMPYSSLAGIMKGSTAATKLVILDCCYAETANQANFGTQSAGVTDALPVDGLYFIGASKKREKAGFPLHGDLTYFTEAFIETVRSGIPGNPTVPELTLAHIFRAVRARLAASRLPEPADSGIRDARQYPFAVNAAFRRPTAAKPEDPGRTARLRLLDHAERAAAKESRGWLGARYRVEALLAIAAAAAPDDPERTRRLTSEAIRLVAASTLEPYQMVAVAERLAAISPKRAEQVAVAIQDPRYRDHALAKAAKVIAAGDPDQAEHVVSMISNAGTKASAMSDVVTKVMAFAPEQAEHLADMISDPRIRQRALIAIAIELAASAPRQAETIAVAVADSPKVVKVAESLAQVDLEAAERVAHSIAKQDDRDEALISVAAAAAPRDLDRARRTIADIATPHHHGWAAYKVSVSCVKDAPDLAEEIARAIPDPQYRTWALHALAQHLAEIDADRTGRLLREAEQACRSITDPADHDYGLGSIASTLAATDLDGALRIARTAKTPSGRAEALSRVAASSASSSYYNAQRVAAMIPDARQHAKTLVEAAAVAARHGQADGARRLLEQAETLAPAISDLRSRAFLLADIAVGLALMDPEHAKRTMHEAEIVGRTILDDPAPYSSEPRDKALEEIAWIAFRNTSPETRTVLRDHAERIACDIQGRREQASALTRIAVATFGEDLDRAELAALAITRPDLRVKALLRLAAEFTSNPLTDPGLISNEGEEHALRGARTA